MCFLKNSYYFWCKSLDFLLKVSGKNEKTPGVFEKTQGIFTKSTREKSKKTREKSKKRRETLEAKTSFLVLGGMSFFYVQMGRCENVQIRCAWGGGKMVNDQRLFAFVHLLPYTPSPRRKKLFTPTSRANIVGYQRQKPMTIK